MKASPFAYVAPTDLAAALAHLREDGARVLAGGQSLIPLMNLRLARPSLLVDVKGVPAGCELEIGDGGVRISFAVSQARVLGTARVRGQAPLLAAALGYVGNQETRNRGTVLGSVAHADPAAELPGVMVALRATYELSSVAGTRSIPAEEFQRGPFLTALADAEMLTGIQIPAATGEEHFGFSEVQRGWFTTCALAAAWRRSPEGISDLRLVAIGIGGRPTRLVEIERSPLLPTDRIRALVLEWAGAAGGHDDGSAARAHALATLVERQMALVVAGDQGRA